MHEAGRLGALLVQFPQRFHRSPAAFDRLQRLVDRSAGWPLVIEVRHISWEPDASADWFAERAVGWCVVDQPSVDGSTCRPLPRVTGPVGYLRMHGRNAADWFRENAGRDARYDYLYNAAELGELSTTARQLAGQVEELYVVQNNHFRGQALVNALQMKRLLQGTPPPAPEELVAAYPALESEVTVQRTRLF